MPNISETLRDGLSGVRVVVTPLNLMIYRGWEVGHNEWLEMDRDYWNEVEYQRQLVEEETRGIHCEGDEEGYEK